MPMTRRWPPESPSSSPAKRASRGIGWFGGLAFLVGGNMAVAASGQGGLLVRVDPAESKQLVTTTPAEEMVMRGRPMRGWLRLDSADVAGGELDVWVERGLAFARSLPPKR